MCASFQELEVNFGVVAVQTLDTSSPKWFGPCIASMCFFSWWCCFRFFFFFLGLLYTLTTCSVIRQRLRVSCSRPRVVPCALLVVSLLFERSCVSSLVWCLCVAICPCETKAPSCSRSSYLVFGHLVIVGNVVVDNRGQVPGLSLSRS